MNAPLLVTPAHSKFGGSNADRIFHCRASVKLIEQVPDYLRRSTVYAQRGTALHEVMALLLADVGLSLESFIGKTFGDYEITIDDVENALRPALAYVNPLLDTPGAEFYVEYRVTFPGIAGAFGTLDLLIRIDRTVYLVDFKFGSGVRVRALCPADDDPTVDVLNAQLMFYIVAARHTNPEFFAGVDNIILTILQPMSIEPDTEMVSSVEVTHAELDEFIAAFRAACEEALSDTPRLKRGAWCRFCAAKPICPEHTKPLLDLAQFVVPAPLQLDGLFAAPPVQKEAYLQALAAGLNLVDAIKDIRTALHDQAKAALENGDVVPGYTLSAGRAERRWRGDQNATCTALWHLGLERNDVFVEEMRSVKQVEIRAKTRGLKVPQELIVSTRSGCSLTRVENAHAPVPQRDELMRSFSEALKAFQEVGTR
jgi:hypothetical protein